MSSKGVNRFFVETVGNTADAQDATAQRDNVSVLPQVGLALPRNPNGAMTLRESAERAITHYLGTLDGTPVTNMYEMVIAEVELPLLRKVLEYTRGNQSRAAELLGINRGTLRKKLKEYKLI